MEQLLHYCWKHRLFPLQQLKTTSGQDVEVIDPGLHNRNAGPDFFNAKVKIDGTLWVGNVEIHDKSCNWRWKCPRRWKDTTKSCCRKTNTRPAIASFRNYHG